MVDNSNELITRFFRIPSSDFKDGKAGIRSNKDILGLDILTDAANIYDFEDGTILTHAIVKDYTIQAMEEMADLEDPLSMAGVIALGLEDTYVGMDYSDTPYVGLFWFLPDLAGTRTELDDEGDENQVNIVPRHRWGAEMTESV